MANQYFHQTQLMLNVLTSIPFDNFALKGGTAINFFYENMPRYSVDIDLVFTKISTRTDAIQEIHQGMKRIKQTLDKLKYNSVMVNASENNPAIKLNVYTKKASIIIEPNTTLRGTLLPVENKELGINAIDTFKVSAAIPCLAYLELYAGKLNAAVDRQHPRDIFDMYLFWQKNKSIKNLMDCFVAYIAQNNRPFSELLEPNELDIARIYETDFVGMTEEKISLDTLVDFRKMLFNQIKKSLSEKQKEFLLSLMQNKPDWSLLSFSKLETMPAMQWKMQNIAKMSADKNNTEIKKLEKIFEI